MRGSKKRARSVEGESSSRKRPASLKLKPLLVHDTKWRPMEAHVTLNATLDQTVLENGDARACNLLVLDNFFGEHERQELLQVMIGDIGEGGKEPPASHWERTTSDGTNRPVSFGPKDEVLQKLTSDPARVVVEMWSRLSMLYPDYTICLQPDNVHFLPPDAPPQQHVCLPAVGNAPIPGDQFRYHLDGDPAAFPSSNWTHNFGSYINHEPGKPMFVSMLLYLCKHWRRDFLAETLILDDSTATGLFVRPRQYRCVLMSQDVLHRISAPSNIATQPRYSVVWKLVFLPKNGNIPPSLARRDWGPPVAFGSAKLSQSTTTQSSTPYSLMSACSSTRTAPASQTKNNQTASSNGAWSSANVSVGEAASSQYSQSTATNSTFTGLPQHDEKRVSRAAAALAGLGGTKTEKKLKRTLSGDRQPLSHPRGVPPSLVTITEPNIHSFMAKSQTFSVDEKYAPLNEIGQGAYGIVCAATDTVTSKRVAIKKVSKVFEDLIDAKRVLREIKLLRHFHHENVVSLYDLVPPPDRNSFNDIYIVLELMETDLHKIIHSNNKLSDDHIQYFIYQILRGLKYIHSAGVMHRDLKPSNILLNGNCDLKICDFGLSRGIEVGDNNLTEYVVTRWYRAPEVMCSCREYDQKIDVWSVGCIMAELHGRKPLFPGKDYIQQMNLIFKVIGSPTSSDTSFITNKKALEYIETQMQRRPPVPLTSIYPTANSKAVNLMHRMLVFNPHRRISVEEALDHPYFQNLRVLDTETTCDELFDFKFDSMRPTKDNLKRAMFEEIALFRPYVNTSIQRTSVSRHRIPQQQRQLDEKIQSAPVGNGLRH